jgi:hypothetical protein
MKVLIVLLLLTTVCFASATIHLGLPYWPGGDGGGGLDPAQPRPKDEKPGNDYQACKTWMGDDEDTGSCFNLIYDHCIEGYTDHSKIPTYILKNMKSVINQIYSNAGIAKSSFHNREPTRFTRVCVANPDKIGKAECGDRWTKDGGKRVWRRSYMLNEYRVHMKGFRPENYLECDHTAKLVSFVKAHVFPNSTVEQEYIGNVGH